MKLTGEEKAAFEAALTEVAQACPHGNVIVVPTASGELTDWEWGQIEEKALASIDSDQLSELARLAPTFAVGIPEKLYHDPEAAEELQALATELKERFRSKIELTHEDELRLRAAMKEAMALASFRDGMNQMCFLAWNESTPEEATRPPFSVHQLTPSDFGIVIPSEWLIRPEVMLRATEILRATVLTPETAPN